MAVFLGFAGVVVFLSSMMIFLVARSATHEIEAMLGGLIGVVLLVGAWLGSKLDQLREAQPRPAAAAPDAKVPLAVPPRPKPAPASPAPTLCRECNSPLRPRDRECRECGAPRVDKGG
jgi:hypothetical protein